MIGSSCDVQVQSKSLTAGLQLAFQLIAALATVPSLEA
jgi:hypothetical protein